MARLSIPDTPTRLTFTLNDFSGGLVNNVNDVKMLDNQSPDMLNMQFRNDGLLQKRPGIIHFLNTKDGDMLVDCIPYEYAPDLYLMIFVAPYHAYYIGFDGEPVLFWVHPIIKVPATETDDEGNEVDLEEKFDVLVFNRSSLPSNFANSSSKYFTSSLLANLCCLQKDSYLSIVELYSLISSKLAEKPSSMSLPAFSVSLGESVVNSLAFTLTL